MFDRVWGPYTIHTGFQCSTIRFEQQQQSSITGQARTSNWICYNCIQNYSPKEEKPSARSIVKFDLIWYQILHLKIAMATLLRHRLNEAYLAAHWLFWLLFWLHRLQQHMCQHYIVKAAGQKLPAKHPRGPRFLTLKLRHAMSPPVAAAPVPCPPAASAKRNVPAPTRSASSEQTKLISWLIYEESPVGKHENSLS